MLHRVLHRLETTEIGRRLDFRSIPSDPVHVDCGRNRAANCGGVERVTQPASRQQRWVDATRQGPDLFECPVDLRGEITQQLLRALRVLAKELAGKLQSDPKGDK